MKTPGDYIREELVARGWGQDDLARIIGKPKPRVNELIQGRLAISPEIATSLSAALGGTPEEWLNREAAYRLSLTTSDLDDVRKKALLYEIAPVRDMEKRGWIKPTETAAELEQELKRFFGVEELSQPPNIPVTTKRTTDKDEYQDLTSAQRAWCFKARAMVAEQVVSRYDPNHFEDCVKDLRALAAFAPEARKVASTLSKHGIRFAIIEPLPSAKIDGAAFWINDDPAIAISARFDRIDGFWFTLCHELSHIRHRDPLSVDTELVGKEALPSAMKLAFEERADNEAGAMLVPPAKLDSFVRRIAPLYSKEKIVQFSYVVKVHPGIIVGQLQHRGEIGWHANRDLLVKIRNYAMSGAIVDGWGH